MMSRRLSDPGCDGVICLLQAHDGRLIVGGEVGYLCVWTLTQPEGYTLSRLVDICIPFLIAIN